MDIQNYRHCHRDIINTFIFKFFLMWPIFKICWICYNIASVLCFGYFFFFFFFFGHTACGILAPQPGIEPIPPALKGCLNQWTTREVPKHIYSWKWTQWSWVMLGFWGPLGGSGWGAGAGMSKDATRSCVLPCLPPAFGELLFHSGLLVPLLILTLGAWLLFWASLVCSRV